MNATALLQAMNITAPVVTNAHVVKGMCSDHTHEKAALVVASAYKHISRTAIKNAERRQRVYDELLRFARVFDAKQTATAVSSAAQVKLSYCQADLVVLRDFYKYVESSENVQSGGKRKTPRLWWVAEPHTRTVSPAGSQP